ncbi:MAG: DNA-binding response regulator [Planctomycetaceae bacterium]|nr:MAG: DNA-binding response regulator [Planctomycetaceae bacterium]
MTTAHYTTDCAHAETPEQQSTRLLCKSGPWLRLSRDCQIPRSGPRRALEVSAVLSRQNKTTVTPIRQSVDGYHQMCYYTVVLLFLTPQTEPGPTAGQVRTTSVAPKPRGKITGVIVQSNVQIETLDCALLPRMLSGSRHQGASWLFCLDAPSNSGTSKQMRDRNRTSMSATVLLIDDDQDVGQMMHDALTHSGYKTLYVQDGLSGIEIVQAQPVDLVLLDLMLPGLDGWEICRRIREFSDVPIISVNTLGREAEVIRGLELGADDYITKPFKLGELKARMRANLRRCKSPMAAEAVVQIDERLAVDRVTHSLIVDRQTVRLSATEYKLLSYFLDNPGRILTQQNLLSQVWGWEYMDQTDYLKVYVHRLRRKIEEEANEPRYILTERGFGYRFQVPGS